MAAPRTYHVLGVPLRTGSLYPGNENDAKAYREAHLIERLRAVGCEAVDDGDLPIPNYLPHHFIPPIRNWPGPRIVWDLVSDALAPHLQRPGHVPLLIGCDCSIVVGTTQALMRHAHGDVHVIYLDGDCDDAPPAAEKCQSAAACASWLLTHASPFWAGPALAPAQVTVIGWTNTSVAAGNGMRSVSLADLRRAGPRETARQVLDAIPASAPVVLHFDIDVLAQREMPAAYFPHTDGVALQECRELLGVLLKDARIRIIEVSEYSVLRDTDQRGIGQLVDLLTTGLTP